LPAPIAPTIGVALLARRRMLQDSAAINVHNAARVRQRNADGRSSWMVGTRQ